MTGGPAARSRARGYALVQAVLTVMLATGVARGAGSWHESERNGRVLLTADGDAYARPKGRRSVAVNFNTLLGTDRVLAASSLALREADTGQRVSHDVAQDRELRYPSGNPVLRIGWTGPNVEAFGRRKWYLYFSTVAPGSSSAWRPLAETFFPGNVVFATSFEEMDPKRPGVPLRISPVGRDGPGQKSERIVSDKVARTGRRSLKVSRTVEPGAPGNSNKPFWWTWPPSIPVAEGGIYRLGVWVKSTRLPYRIHSTVVMRYCNVNRSGMRGEEAQTKIRGPMVVSDWTYLTMTLAAPEGAHYLLVYLCLGLQGEVFFDDLTVTRLAGSELRPARVRLGPVVVKPDSGEPRAPGRVLQQTDGTVNAVTARPMLAERMFRGKGRLPVLLSNRRARPVDVNVTVTDVTQPERPKRAGRTNVLLDPGSEAITGVPCTFGEPGKVRLRFEVSELPGGDLLYVTSGEFTVPALLGIRLRSSLSYLGDATMVGVLQCGLSPEQRARAHALLGVLVGGKAGPRPKRVELHRETEPVALDVSRLPKGSHVIRAELVLRGRRVATQDVSVERTRGPFDMDR